MTTSAEALAPETAQSDQKATFWKDQGLEQSDMDLDTALLAYERKLITAALEQSGGSITRAARLLGVTHQGLAFILNGRQSEILSLRTPIKRRRKSIMKVRPK